MDPMARLSCLTAKKVPGIMTARKAVIGNGGGGLDGGASEESLPSRDEGRLDLVRSVLLLCTVVMAGGGLKSYRG